MKNPRVAEALLPLKAQLEQERDAILALSAPLHARRQTLLDQLQPLEAELKRIDDDIHALEQPRLRDLGNELAAIARQIGPTVTLTNEG